MVIVTRVGKVHLLLDPSDKGCRGIHAKWNRHEKAATARIVKCQEFQDGWLWWYERRDADVTGFKPESIKLKIDFPLDGWGLVKSVITRLEGNVGKALTK